MDVKKKYVSVDYTSKDFNSIRNDLVNYAKRYYPETVKDFSEASFASLMVDMVSYVGDMLSFYSDYQFNESLLATANDYENIIRLAKQMGFKYKPNARANGIAALYCLVPANTSGIGPNSTYIPILKRGSMLNSNNGVPFMLMEDVRFDNPNNEVVAARVDQVTNLPTSYAIKSYGMVTSAEQVIKEITVGDFQSFLRVNLQDSSADTIVRVYDEQGNEYYEVEYLSQDTIFRTERNIDPTTNEQTPDILVPMAVPRRFVVERQRNKVELVFGQGSQTQLKENRVMNPADITVERYGRDYVTDVSFDPVNFLQNESLGIGPANTKLFVIYTKTVQSANIPVGSLRSILRPIIDFTDPSQVPLSVRTSILSNFEAYNEEPIYSNTPAATAREIKTQALSAYAAQNRAVTSQDYEAICYNLPPNLGSLRRVRAVRDYDSLKRNINLYVISQDPTGKFAGCNSITKQNLKTWLGKYKLINDTVDILDARIVNIQINFEIVVSEPYNKFEVLADCTNAITQEFSTPMQIGQAVSYTSVYTILNKIEGVSDVTNVKIKQKTGQQYASATMNLDVLTSIDGKKIVPPENVVFELKFPETDIIGSVI